MKTFALTGILEYNEKEYGQVTADPAQNKIKRRRIV